jgi:acetyltransferase-like isoleucine patch superfamily enzyme
MRYIAKVRGLLRGHSDLSLGRKVILTKHSDLIFHGPASFGSYSLLTAIGGKIIFGSNFSGSQEVIYNADISGTLIFGDNCLVGPKCIFRTANHNFSSLEIPIRKQGHTSKNINVGEDVWIGANVIVLPGVTIGNHAVIGAGSVITSDIQDYAVAVGNPAKVIKLRN